jgi:hypothetical protein
LNSELRARIQQAADKPNAIHEITRNNYEGDVHFRLFRVISWISITPAIEAQSLLHGRQAA